MRYSGRYSGRSKKGRFAKRVLSYRKRALDGAVAGLLRKKRRSKRWY